MSKFLLVVLLAASTLLAIGSCQETTTVAPTTSGTTKIEPSPTTEPVETTEPLPTTEPPGTSEPVSTTEPATTETTVLWSDTTTTTDATTPPGEVGGIACDHWRDDGDDPTVPNYGDMICEYAPGGELIFRETLINQEVFLGYQKTLLGYTVGRVQALNFGDVKGFVTAIDIMHNGGSVDIGVYTEIEPEQQMRLQVEIYGWKEE